MQNQLDVMECDVAVIGGGLGGVAAALAAAESGAQVILSEQTPWIGGQVTSQAVSALDEYERIESVPPTRSYATFRQAIRRYYQETYALPTLMPDGRPLNPGDGWVSSLCFEPRVGLKVLEEMLSPHVDSGRLRILRHYHPVTARSRAGRIQSVTLAGPRGKTLAVQASTFLDATELGDLLPLAGIAYTTGAEAQAETDEPHASPDGPHPGRVQSFTYCFLVEFCPGENHIIRKPSGYERFKRQQPYSLTLNDKEGRATRFPFFTANSDWPLPFWTYRRVIDGKLLDPSGQRNDISLINWASNDYRWANIIDQPSERTAAILQEARWLSLGFLYWLQTEVERQDGTGHGYPELKLLPQAVGTRSGLSMAPYIRESRRIHGLYRIVEQDIVAEGKQGMDQATFFDSVGIGWYAMDLHPAVGDDTSLYVPTLPFQIPLGALIPLDCENLLACCKNICTTHLTNGAYRLHPVEWSIGEAAGALSAFCIQHSWSPGSVRQVPERLQAFQQFLKDRGMRIQWPAE